MTLNYDPKIHSSENLALALHIAMYEMACLAEEHQSVSHVPKSVKYDLNHALKEIKQRCGFEVKLINKND